MKKKYLFLDIDGVFGATTEQAVKDAQKTLGLGTRSTPK